MSASGTGPGTTAGPGVGFIVGNVLALLLVTAVASLTLWPVYQSREFVVLVAASFALGTVIAVLGARFRWPAWILLLVTVGSYLLVGVPLAVPGLAIGGLLPSAAGLIELLAASALSWKRLVTIVLPVGNYQSLLVPALILVLGSTVIGLSIALRSRWGELAVLAPIVLFLAGILLGPTNASTPIELGLGFFVLVLLWLLWFRAERRRRHIRLITAQSPRTIASAGERSLAAARGLVGAAVIIALAIVAGTTASLAVPPPGSRDVVRAHIQPPFDPRDYTSPLSEFRGYWQRADAPLLTVEGLPTNGRLRIATLDSYDGVVYSVGSDTVSSLSGSFTRLPYRLDQSTVDGEALSLLVTVRGYTGVWVPGIGALEQIEFLGDSAVARADSFFYNDTSGSAAVLTGLRRGDRYRSESVIPRTPGELASARPGSAVLPAVGVVPAGLADAIEAAVDRSDPPGVQLTDALESLRTRGYVSHGVEDEPVSRSGHGADRIAQLFRDQPMLGDGEQYAVAAALMARNLGFPARVVLGFAPDTSAAAETVNVTGADVSAWIEVQTSADGWVPIDPNPPVRDVPAKQPDDPTIVARPQSVLPPPEVDPIDQLDPSTPERNVEDPAPPLAPWLAILLGILTIAGWTLLVLLALIGPFLAIVLAKARRRKLRRSTGSPGARIDGGWREFSDTALDFGFTPPNTGTHLEVAESVGGMRPLVLATLVDRAAFAPDRPTGADADRVWDAVAELRHGLASGKGRRERLRALLSLRSLGRYAGKTRTRATRGAGS